MSYHNDTLLWIKKKELCLGRTWHMLSRKNNAWGQSTPPPPNSYDGKTALTKAAPLLVPNYQRLSRTFCALSICLISDKKGGFSHLVERVTNGGPEPGHTRGGATAGSLHYPACTSSFGTAYSPIKVIGKVRMDTTTHQYCDLLLTHMDGICVKQWHVSVTYVGLYPWSLVQDCSLSVWCKHQIARWNVCLGLKIPSKKWWSAIWGQY